jgi:hypothetical protein
MTHGLNYSRVASPWLVVIHRALWCLLGFLCTRPLCFLTDADSSPASLSYTSETPCICFVILGAFHALAQSSRLGPPCAQEFPLLLAEKPRALFAVSAVFHPPLGVVDLPRAPEKGQRMLVYLINSTCPLSLCSIGFSISFEVVLPYFLLETFFPLCCYSSNLSIRLFSAYTCNKIRMLRKEHFLASLSSACLQSHPLRE